MTKTINRSLAHGLEILFLYDANTPFLSVAEISKHLRYSQSKTYRLIRTLIKYGLVQEIPGTAQYCLGLNALRIGLLVQQNLNLSVIARPLMKKLSLLSKETILLTVVNGTRGMCLEKVESDEPIRLSFQPGATLPLHCGASSKILMAYLPEEEWDRIIMREGLMSYTPNTITQADQLKKHLREIREKGYVFSDREMDWNARAVGAPIFDGSGRMVAGLSIAGPVYRITKKRVRELVRLVVQYAKEISYQLGYIPREQGRKGKRRGEHVGFSHLGRSLSAEA